MPGTAGIVGPAAVGGDDEDGADDEAAGPADDVAHPAVIRTVPRHPSSAVLPRTQRE
jgi:hypothetical protein